MDKELIKQRIERLKQLLKAIKEKFPGMNQKNIIKAIGYKRAGTLSDYKNLDNYDDKNFKDFLNLLVMRFDVNPGYVLDGEVNTFNPSTAKNADNIRSSVNLLVEEINQLKEENRTLKQQLEEKNKDVKNLKQYSQSEEKELENHLMVAEKKPNNYSTSGSSGSKQSSKNIAGAGRPKKADQKSSGKKTKE
jgi:hypothetical protein